MLSMTKLSFHLLPIKYSKINSVKNSVRMQTKMQHRESAKHIDAKMAAKSVGDLSRYVRPSGDGSLLRKNTFLLKDCVKWVVLSTDAPARHQCERVKCDRLAG